MRALRESLGLRPIPVEWEDFHFSCKAGPMGQATVASLSEALLLSPTLVQSIKVLGGQKLGAVLDYVLTPIVSHEGALRSVAEIWSSMFPQKRKSLRKVSYFADKEGKTRVIAILDYWSQTALKPYHDALNNVLRRLPCDCTFNQSAFLEILPKSAMFSSLDLSNATDRMPLALQKVVMECLFGKPRTEA